ncbi:hypothetical protein GGI21_003816, partial [Coemansia aciculifera]
MIAAVFEAGLFATASYNSPLVKIWRLVGSNGGDEELPFQYVVHSVAVHGLFWRQRTPNSEHTHDKMYSLCSLTRDGQMYVWRLVRSLSKGVCARSMVDDSVAITLTSTIDLAHAPPVEESGSGKRRALIAANILSRPLSEFAKEVASSSATMDVDKSEPMHSNEDHDSATNLPQPVSHAQQQPPSDFIYAAYSDGSMNMWE